MPEIKPDPKPEEYPKVMRFHADGRHIIVKSDAMNELYNPSTGWMDDPFPPPKVEPKKEFNPNEELAKINERLTAVEASVREVKASNDVLTKANEDLNEMVSNLMVQVEQPTTTKKSGSKN